MFIGIDIFNAFNLDYEYTVLKNGPKNSSFGFSVAGHQEGKNNRRW